jgi:hypothetical protein
LPEEYIAQPSVRLGDIMEIDIATRERESSRRSFTPIEVKGSAMIASWAPARPNILLDTEYPESSESEPHFRLYHADELDGGLPLPGFRIPIASLFPT